MRYLLPALSLLSFLLAAATAQQRISLDGTWQVRPEPGGSYRPVHVPGAFEVVLGDDFDGAARYRRKLPLPDQRTRRTFVEFDAVATRAEVFVNGRRVKQHLGGWTPFRAELTRHLKWDGSDTLEVLVDERVGHNTQGFLPIIQPHFGGIWQSVTLCCGAAPQLDRHDLFTYARLLDDGTGELTVRAGVVRGDRNRRGDALKVELRGDEGVLFRDRRELGGFHEPWRIEGIEPWRPGAPRLYTLRIALVERGREVDVLERRVGFRSLRADGTRVLWNGEPFQLRGVLHWGYAPPSLCPPSDPAHWRPQLEHFASLGFNTVKCCLWMPPRGFYELCDELGLAVWQEYPTWHPKMDQAHKRELLREYREFFALDKCHPSVAFRSITCETGHGADLDVVKTLFDACKTEVPDTLVVDDSSWIGWQRVTDFWDEHPYGNNSWFPGRLAEFRKHIEQHGAKPLLLGECLAADTWVDREAWLRTHGTSELWWRPWCWDAQRDAEAWLRREFGSDLVASLDATSRAFGLANRRFQIEQLRLGIPEAGYVVSVARDFPKARMGLIDDLGRPKWRADDWSWHRDTMLCLENRGYRTIGPGDGAHVSVSVSHFGAGPLHGRLKLRLDGEASGWDLSGKAIDALPPGPIDADQLWRRGGSKSILFSPFGPQSRRLERLRIDAALTGTHPAEAHWHIWHHPGYHRFDNRDEVIDAEVLTPELIRKMEAGAKVFLQVKDRTHSLHTESMWFLKGAPFAPKHPLHDLLPAQCLLETCGFDLESGRVIPWAAWKDQVDPILAFWETHDIREVRFHLHAFDTNVGKGRLLATALKLDDERNDFGGYVADLMRDHLANGPAPQRSLQAATIRELVARLQERTIDLPTWRFRTDPDGVGLQRGWHTPDADASTAAWRDLQAGSHWENQGEDLKHYTGVAWYRVDVEVPEDWRGLDARCVLEGVDDSCHLWLNGELIDQFGDEASKTTIWLERQVAELQQRLKPGQRNTLVLRVVDHAGAGGLWKPVRLTTGPVAEHGRRLR